MAISDHPNGEFVSPKTEKEFRVEAYPSFIPFIDRKKLTSHPYIFAPVCYAGHWWLWLINTRKRKCQILDPLHKIAPTDERKAINKFTGYVFSRLITYAGGEPSPPPTIPFPSSNSSPSPSLPSLPVALSVRARFVTVGRAASSLLAVGHRRFAAPRRWSRGFAASSPRRCFSVVASLLCVES
ncbi:uncharacterized protein LOC110269203 [Arachis ipaensis]|uniref:uncharacterized protein LOC110269203 n=1 Tax=Arachis ipaensis TaxID=130454 RepID=UPI000A2B889D|nr:uncharacterized protein LOC110269203 [Arachis ipaensis]